MAGRCPHPPHVNDSALRMATRAPAPRATPAAWRVLVTYAVVPAVRAVFQSTEPPMEIVEWPGTNAMPAAEVHRQLATGFDAVLLIPLTRFGASELAAAGPRLRIVASASAGFEHIDSIACKAAGVLVSNAPLSLNETTADTALCLVLAACRRFKEASASVVDGSWGTWTIMGMCGMDIHAATVGVVGLGNIGGGIARRLRGFDCKILYTGPRRKIDAETSLDAEYVAFDELLQRSDIVVAACPLNGETRGLFDAKAFAQMKSTAVFINISRGATVVQDDLVAALERGSIFAAGLDVTTPEPIEENHPLVKHPNCVITPHLGSATVAARTATACHAAKNVVAAFHGGPLLSEVNQ